MTLAPHYDNSFEPADERPRVVVIEDDADTRSNLRDILELAHYQVETASVANEALQDIDWRGVFAIILDRKLPDGNAEQVLPLLRRAAPDAAVLVVTGYTDLEGAVACLRQGAADYILKPLNADALLASLGNIAERRRLEQEHHRSEEVFRILVEASDCVILILRADHTLCYFSPFAERLTGYSTHEVMGSNALKLFVEPQVVAEMEAELASTLTGSPLRGYEQAMTSRSGEKYWILWNARRIDDYQGSPAILAVGQDITRYKQAAERSLQNERLAAIGQMVTGLAHESRNALQRSKACLEMLAIEVEDRPEAIDLVRRVHNAQNHLHRLYEEVRAYAAPISLYLERCRLDELWRETWNSLAADRQGKNIELCERIQGIHCGVVCDSFAVGQVFRNILENAIAACPVEGRLTIACREAILEDQAAIEVRFHDNGPGLNIEQRQKIFDPFYTTKTRGTGLGMAIARRIVNAHGGRIEVAANPGSGAELIVTLPRNRL